MSTPLNNPDVTQAKAIVHALAKATQDSNTLPSAHKWYPYSVYFEIDAWPVLARELLRQGCDWPALQELAALPVPDDNTPIPDEITAQAEDVVTQLVTQTASDALLPYWDLLCAIAARKWELEKQERGSAAEPWAYASIMDAMWWTAREVPDDYRAPGVTFIWRGMGLKEVIGFQDIDKEMTELLEEAGKLEISVPLDAQTCQKILAATY